MSKPKYYLSTPIHSAALEPQIGSLYSAILCDAIARHKRMCGFDVAHFMSAESQASNPENGEQRAEAGRAASLHRGYKPFAELLNLVNVHGTHFQYTGSPEHVLAVEELIHRIMRRSRLAIYKSAYQGRYCPHDRMDVSDSTDPVDCAICGRAAELISEERHFFRLSAFQDRLAALYKYHPGFIQPHDRVDEVRSTVARALKDVPISRKSNPGGIRWPGEPDYIVHERFANLTSYLSGVRFGQTEDINDEFRHYWPPNLHVIGRDSLWSHAIFWPALLMAADLPLPRHIFTHGAVCLEQDGTGATFFFELIVRVLGSDAVRYYFLRDVGSHEVTRLDLNRVVEYENVDLVQGLESLASRIHALLTSHSDGKIPSPSLFSGIDPTVEIALGNTRAEVRFLLDRFDFSEALRKIWSFVAVIQKRLDDNSGRELSNDPGDKQRFTNVLYDACEGLGWIALLLHPVLPHATDAIWSSLGQTTKLEHQLIDEAPWNCLMSGTHTGKLEELFPKVDNLQNAAQLKTKIRATH